MHEMREVRVLSLQLDSPYSKRGLARYCGRYGEHRTPTFNHKEPSYGTISKHMGGIPLWSYKLYWKIYFVMNKCLLISCRCMEEMHRGVDDDRPSGFRGFAANQIEKKKK